MSGLPLRTDCWCWRCCRCCLWAWWWLEDLLPGFLGPYLLGDPSYSVIVRASIVLKKISDGDIKLQNVMLFIKQEERMWCDVLPVWLVTGRVSLLAQVEVVQWHRGRHRARDHGQPRVGGEGGHGGHARPAPRVRHNAAISLTGPRADTEMTMTVRKVVKTDFWFVIPINAFWSSSRQTCCN